MTTSIQRSKTEHQKNIEQITQDISETMETIEIQNIELDMARKEAIKGSQIKSEFLANISHEIRTPLSGIIGFTELLQKTNINFRQAEYLSTIENSANGLLTIINDILDLSKIDAGNWYWRILILICAIYSRRFSHKCPRSSQKSLELNSLINMDVPLALKGDPLRIKQILTNLISNAIKFTAQGSISVRIITLHESAQTTSLRFEITDTGIGLSREQKDNLFKAFSQADSSTTRQFGGTGLGLIISQHLVKAMKGDIEVRSEYGEGATFAFSIDLTRGQLQPTISTQLKGTNILVLESSPLTRLSINHQLEQWQIYHNAYEDSDTFLQRIQHKAHNQEVIDAVIIGLSRQELYSEKHSSCSSTLMNYSSLLLPSLIPASTTNSNTYKI